MNTSWVNRNKNLLIIGLTVLFIILFSPILFYFLNFWKNPVSENPSDWGVFGDYIGGVLNPVISLISLVLLGYLTYLISTLSDKENFKRQLSLRRLDAYTDFIEGITIVNGFSGTVSSSLGRLLNSAIEEGSHERTVEMLKFETSIIFSEYEKIRRYRHYIFHFCKSNIFLFPKSIDPKIIDKLTRSVKEIEDAADKIYTTFHLCTYGGGISKEIIQKRTEGVFENIELNRNIFNGAYSEMVSSLISEIGPFE